MMDSNMAGAFPPAAVPSHAQTPGRRQRDATPCLKQILRTAKLRRSFFFQTRRICESAVRFSAERAHL